MYEVRFYTTPGGNQPVRDYLWQLHAADPDESASITDAIMQLRKHGTYELTLIKLAHNHGNFIELRGGHQRIGYIWDRKAEAFFLLHAWKKSKKGTTKQDIKTTETRLKGHLARGGSK